MEKQNLQAGKVDERFPFLELTGSSSKKQRETDIWIKEDGFILGLRLDWKILETFYGSCKLNCDHLLDIHHFQIKTKRQI